MKISKRLLAWSIVGIALVAGVGVAEPASARAFVSIGIALPPLRIEHVVVRPGYIRAPGYWRWNGTRHVWIGEYWLPARRGNRYFAAGWAHVGPGWRFHRGYRR